MGWPHDMYPPLDHWLWLVAACLLGACVGSFLNVVIHRLPLGLSVNEPRRSFCPHCRKQIPVALNLPLVSWLWLRGKCRECGARISFRYFAVELLEAALFGTIWWFFSPLAPLAAIPVLWALAAILTAVCFIDAEHMIIPGELTWTGTLAGLAGCALWPLMPGMGGDGGTWWQGLMHGSIGWVAGFVGLGLVVEMGKLMFGRKKFEFGEAVAWKIREPENDEDTLWFDIGGESLSWWDIFGRKSDELRVEAGDIRVDGVSAGGGTLVIRCEEIELPGGGRKLLADLKSVDGTATRAVVPREAMGMGDVHLLAMIGAFFGWTGVIFSLAAACPLALAAALGARVGFGRHLPFGPFLALAAMVWLFGGWKWFAWYAESVAPVFQR